MTDHSLANPPATGTSVASRRALARVAAFSRTEHGIVALALGTIALHVADDNYLQPEPGTSPLDHLASGLVPLAVFMVVGVLYPRLPAAARAATAMTFGAIGIAFGIPGAYYLLKGSASGDHYTGLLAIVAGSVLLLSGPVTLWRGRRSDRSRRRRYVGRVLPASPRSSWLPRSSCSSSFPSRTPMCTPTPGARPRRRSSASPLSASP